MRHKSHWWESPPNSNALPFYIHAPYSGRAWVYCLVHMPVRCAHACSDPVINCDSHHSQRPIYPPTRRAPAPVLALFLSGSSIGWPWSFRAAGRLSAVTRALSARSVALPGYQGKMPRTNRISYAHLRVKSAVSPLPRNSTTSP